MNKKTEEKNNDKVTKDELISAVYSRCSLQKKDIRTVVDLFLDELKTSISQKKTVELRGFGTFEPRVRKAQEHARNPRTGEIVQVQERYTSYFKPGQEIKQALRFDCGSETAGSVQDDE